MRLAILLLLLAACSRAQPAGEAPADGGAAVGTLAIPAAPPPSGVVEMEDETSVSAKVRIYDRQKFGGYVTASLARHRLTRSEPAGGKRRKVTYVVDRMTEVSTASERPLPVEGKSYIVDDGGGISSSDGSVVPVAELAVVRADVSTLDAPSPLAAVLAGKSLSMGAQLDVPDDVLARLSTSRLTWKRLTYLLKGRRGGAIVVVWTGAIEEDWGNGLTLEGNLVGEALFDAQTGQCTEATSDGPVTVRVHVRTNAGDLVGSGRMQSRVVRRSPPATP
jgi:hypothetical protein